MSLLAYGLARTKPEYEERLMGPTNEELATHLNGLNPSNPLGTALHTAILRLTVSACIEAVVLRESAGGGRLQVLLRQRGPNDASYPNQWHCPGSFLRPSETLDDVFRRLTNREGLGEVASYESVENYPWQEQRGTILSMIYLVTLCGDPTRGEWFDVDSLPPGMVDQHKHHIIPAATKHYKCSRK